MTVKEFFSSLIGLTIEEASKRLGYWWVCMGNHINAWDRTGNYTFERPAGGWVELNTEFKNGRNEVVSEHHNRMAEFYQKRDL